MNTQYLVQQSLFYTDNSWYRYGIDIAYLYIRLWEYSL